MFIDKGYAVGFRLAGRRGVLWLPDALAILHDPDGKEWPKCSVLLSRFSTRGARLATSSEMSGAPKAYLGRGYEGQVVRFRPPPRDLAQWEEVGDATKVYYVRTGIKHPGGFKHPFNVRRAMFLWTRGKTPKLYKRGSQYRLDLGSGCIVDDRGFVRP